MNRIFKRRIHKEIIKVIKYDKINVIKMKNNVSSDFLTTLFFPYFSHH